MYQFHYGTILERYGDKARLLFTDTDSLCYEIETDDVYRDMMTQIDLYDTADYPKDHFLHSSKNSKVIGKFKDECSGKAPLEFVGLSAKMYSLRLADEKQKSAVKGVKTSYARRHLDHETFVDCFNSQLTHGVEFRRISSTAHKVTTVTMQKVGLSPYDDKRYIVDGAKSLAYGHKGIRQLTDGAF